MIDWFKDIFDLRNWWDNLPFLWKKIFCVEISKIPAKYIHSPIYEIHNAGFSIILKDNELREILLLEKVEFNNSYNNAVCDLDLTPLTIIRGLKTLILELKLFQ